jgi:hypothetical protein
MAIAPLARKHAAVWAGLGKARLGHRAAAISLVETALDGVSNGDYCENMKNITVSLDDESYRRARMIAAQRDTSVSALVKRFLLELGSGETEAERLKREERELRVRITAFQASDRLSRDDLHRRGV